MCTHWDNSACDQNSRLHLQVDSIHTHHCQSNSKYYYQGILVYHQGIVHPLLDLSLSDEDLLIQPELLLGWLIHKCLPQHMCIHWDRKIY
jgi:hypothetical protein